MSRLQRMKRRVTTILRILSRAVVALLLFPFLTAHRPFYLQNTSLARELVLRFQQIAVRSMKDSTSDRSHAIDLYWEAYYLAGRQGTEEELQRLIGGLYTRLRGGRIARVKLDDSGWIVASPSETSETVVLTYGRTCENLLLVVSNQTQTRRPFP